MWQIVYWIVHLNSYKLSYRLSISYWTWWFISVQWFNIWPCHFYHHYMNGIKIRHISSFKMLEHSLQISMRFHCAMILFLILYVFFDFPITFNGLLTRCMRRWPPEVGSWRQLWEASWEERTRAHCRPNSICETTRQGQAAYCTAL